MATDGKKRTVGHKWMAAAVFAASWSATGGALACSTFCLDGLGGPVFGKNYDWEVSDGMVVVNKRNVAKTALTSDRPASWTSIFGSVTFNQYGREMPCGGMNEAGLVVELMWLDGAGYPPADDRPALDNLQWIQYHLDRSATVADVIAGDEVVRISGAGQAMLHFLVADSTGACAAVEYIDGEMEVHTGPSLPAPVLTNHTYRASLAYLAQHEGFGGDRPVPSTRRSLDRFVRAAAAVSEFDLEAGGDAVDYAFGVLASVAQTGHTRWSIVYQIGARRVSFKTHDNRDVRTVHFDRLDFECDSPVLVLDLSAPVSGDVTGRFKPYTYDGNRSLVGRSFSQTSFLSDTPESVLDAIAGYPGTTKCQK